ncbi:hypothetical protein FORMB_23450 [Formosa sp. Hel1_33_131]|jgi:hypothetical protein|uniref:lipocalin family protein n=1 Tax=Formosa sp. Hel1_33_131 TaxID=1336794 RepID=UPI00084E227A|nr:lipocalin family protein [Formosa sp. Hel1_33_131]AOR29363.1 hypothetical protein FORMB_23450 [Formosa sp. Hel1_33_131]
MKKCIFILFFLSISNTFAQTVSEDILGQWQLQTLQVDNDKITAKEAFETNNVFQIYSENNQFEGIVGEKNNKGTWELSDNQKSVYIKLDIQKEGQEFTITKLSATELVLDIIDNDQVITFSYVKKM